MGLCAPVACPTERRMADSQQAAVSEAEGTGLCARCRHARRIAHPRGGAAYWRCGMHDTAPWMPKFPRLPVERCASFVPSEPTPEPRR